MRHSELRLLEAVPGPYGEAAWVEIRSSRHRFVVLSLLVAVLLLVLFAIGLHRRSRTTTLLVPVTVERGDTLWSLARNHCGSHEYLPRAVHAIRRANGLSNSRLVPGQKLMIPVEVPVAEPPSAPIMQAKGPQPSAHP
ncbi:MAG TPA: LysM peptidoglycan-binding domain-containing protein [Armatimonadota bacterium]|jgi:hypothetical protein|nr:LysM peptidoglycan-binding domain-containing protein [Armatimonadota bacterium]HOJ20498.1 LysM peptidoglycan-binding domain-containing protein [Armatimonadota bacterium]HOM83624.1 LysM peptidoglycan-binding domain-containing protein [Armatimonadota bacterium]HOQ27165.1 LysM peptidoglycan-binding domain-containing protein [Armatimonadota bacterium]HPO73784.1 LysM peptidoglycan-binding domain-containing protein [Armatimonadota bacterium]